MVGHTHEDIDQFFSKMAQYLRYNSCHTLPGMLCQVAVYTTSYTDVIRTKHADLQSSVAKCYSDVPEANMVEYMFDVRSWIAPHLNKLEYHSHPHIFRFSKSLSGSVTMFYKDWTNSPWKPSSGDGISLFKVAKCDRELLCIYFILLPYTVTYRLIHLALLI